MKVIKRKKHTKEIDTKKLSQKEIKTKAQKIAKQYNKDIDSSLLFDPIFEE